MNRVSQSMMRAWIGMGTRFLPFADAATEEVPLSRLLRLSLFQVSAGMTLVLLVGTLNRVMIVELGVPASLVSVMLAIPLILLYELGIYLAGFIKAYSRKPESTESDAAKAEPPASEGAAAGSSADSGTGGAVSAAPAEPMAAPAGASGSPSPSPDKPPG